MSDVQVAGSSNPTELLALGRRHLAVKDFSAAVETLATACEMLAKEHGDMADQCAEAYLWYGKSLLGLSRQESGVLGDGVPGGANADDEDDDDQEENGEDEQNGEAKAGETSEAPKESAEVEKNEPESTSKDDEPSSSKPQGAEEEPGTSNGEGNDESIANLENEDDVDNLQLAWEMLDLSRSILQARVKAAGGAGGSAGGEGAGAGGEGGGAGGAGAAARALLADVHLALGEVALESETYDKAVCDMQSCLVLQKELYSSDDRRIAETHYQMGLANSLASNFEDAITHFKNAANILETRIKNLEAVAEESVNKHSTDQPQSASAEIKELTELLPEIQEKIQDMMDYKAETMKRLREALFSSNGDASTNGAASFSSAAPDRPASNISHLIRRKRKASDDEPASAPKKPNT